MSPITGNAERCARATNGHATAVPPTTNVMNSRRLIAFPGFHVANSRHANLFDYLVSEIKYIARDGKPNGFRGSQIDDELKFGRLFDGKVPWPRTLNNLVDVGCGAAEKICYAHTVAHEAAILHVTRCVVHVGDAVPLGAARHSCSIGEEVRT